MKTKASYSAQREDSAEIVLPADLRRVPSQQLLSIADSFSRKIAAFADPEGHIDNHYGIRLIDMSPTYKRVQTDLLDFKVLFGENEAGNVHAIAYVSGNSKSRLALMEEREVVEPDGKRKVVLVSIEPLFGAYLTDLVQTDMVFAAGSPLERMRYRIADARQRIPLSEADVTPRPHIRLVFPKAGIYNGEGGKDPSSIGTDIYLLTISPMLAWFMPKLNEKIRAMLKQ